MVYNLNQEALILITSNMKEFSHYYEKLIIVKS